MTSVTTSEPTSSPDVATTTRLSWEDIVVVVVYFIAVVFVGFYVRENNCLQSDLYISTICSVFTIYNVLCISRLCYNLPVCYYYWCCWRDNNFDVTSTSSLLCPKYVKSTRNCRQASVMIEQKKNVQANESFKRDRKLANVGTTGDAVSQTVPKPAVRR